jgi:hypothetical protein
MAMAESDIDKGWIYRTSHNHEWLVLGWDRDGRVVYASKGHDETKQFQNCHVCVTPKKFAQRAIGKVRQVENLRAFVVATKATTVVVR